MDWRKLTSTTGLTLRGKMVHWQQIEGEAGALLHQHFDPHHRQYLLSRSRQMGEVILAHTGAEGLTGDCLGILSDTKTYLQFVCSDSRVVPTELPSGKHFVFSVGLAGQSLGGTFSYKQIVDLLPALDGIVIESHSNCGACRAADLASQGQVFDGSLATLTGNVKGDIRENLLAQIQHLIQRVGKELLLQHQVAVLGVHHDIFSSSTPYSLVEETVAFNATELPKVQDAIAVYRSMLAAQKDRSYTPADESQHPRMLWLSGLNIFGQFKRGIGSEHELVNENRKGLIFKVVWQSPYAPSAIASARYILEHGDSIRQIVFTASSERDLWWDIESFVNHAELSFYLKQHIGTELIGVIIGENGYARCDRIVKLWSIEAQQKADSD